MIKQIISQGYEYGEKVDFNLEFQNKPPSQETITGYSDTLINKGA